MVNHCAANKFHLLQKYQSYTDYTIKKWFNRNGYYNDHNTQIVLRMDWKGSTGYSCIKTLPNVTKMDSASDKGKKAARADIHKVFVILFKLLKIMPYNLQNGSIFFSGKGIYLEDFYIFSPLHALFLY